MTSSVQTRWLPIALLVALHILVIGLMFSLPAPAWQFYIRGRGYQLPLALAFAQIGVVSAWAAWGSQRLALRLSVSIVWTILVGLATISALRFRRPLGTDDMVVILAAMTLFGMAMQGMCWLARGFGIEWVAIGGKPHSGSRQSQFHLRELLILTTVIAMVFGALRLVFLQRPSAAWTYLDWDRVTLCVILALGNLLIANTIITVFHSRRPRFWNLGITLILTAVIGIMEYFSVLRLLYPLSTYLFVWQCGIFVSWLLISFALIRGSGFRLARVRVWDREGRRMVENPRL